MSVSRKKYLVIGAGPVGAKCALDLEKEFKDSIDIEIVEKRLTPGGRHEVLFLSEESLQTLPKDVYDDLFSAPNEDKPVKAFHSGLVYHYSGSIVKESHGIITIHDLESALCNAIEKRKISMHRGLEFLTAEKGKAFFKNEKGETFNKEYDTLILAMGLSGSLKNSQQENNILEAPRLLHDFPVLVARFKANFKEFKPKEEPATISYFTPDRMVGFFVCPDSAAIFISIPQDKLNQLSSDEAQLNFLSSSLEKIPTNLKYLLDNVSFDRPSIIKIVPAIATLTPKLLDREKNIYLAGDGLGTFPFVWGSETNIAYTASLPLLIKHFVNIHHCPEQHEKLTRDYEYHLKKVLTENKYFLRLSPFGEHIEFGTKNEKNEYSFPGWEKLSEQKPYTKNSMSKFDSFLTLMPPSFSNSIVSKTGIYSDKSQPKTITMPIKQNNEEKSSYITHP